MVKLSLIILFALCASGVCPAASISRWFSSSYYDLRVTLRRFGHCVKDLPPLKDQSLNETDYLVNRMRAFLDQANYDNEQFANITNLMDLICFPETDYPISLHIDVEKYSNNETGKENRCRAIEEVMNSMFYVFKRAALNRSEPLDFSVIQFYPNATNKAASYNLTDLINTSWIKSEIMLDHVCKITDSIKEYVQGRVRKLPSQARGDEGFLRRLMDLIDRLYLEPILGLQKRLYWESTNRLELGYSRLSNQLGNLRDGFGNRYKSTRDAIASMFISSNNATIVNATNNTKFNSTSGLLNLTLTQMNGTDVKKQVTAQLPVSNLNRTTVSL